ncbi:MAG TPA: hypothetical protein VM328_01150, partial [Fimbriimonadaceae bacterium]|nr:hypothetical protein [Fimbriimonadaceae bacterium]
MTRITPAILAGIALASAASAQDLQAKITYSNRGAAARTVLRDLSALTGLQLETSPQTANDVLQVRVKDVPASELLKRIAEVANAEWRPEGSLYRLSRPQLLVQELQRKEIADRSEGIAEAIKQMTAGVDQPFGQAEAQQLKNNQPRLEAGAPIRLDQARSLSGPAGRLLGRLLRALNPADLAAIQPSQRVVYSSLATRMQRQMPPAAGRLISQFPPEHNAWAETVSAQPPDPNARPIPLPFGPDASAKVLDKPLGKVLLIVTRSGASPGLSLELRVYDNQGGRVTSASAFLSPRTTQTSDNSPARASDGSALQFSPEALQLAKAISSGALMRSGAVMMISMQEGNAEPLTIGTVPGATQPLAPAVRELLANPDKVEPLSLFAGPIVEGMAGEANVVAYLPDSLLSYLPARIASGSSSKAQLETLLRQDPDLIVAIEGTWFTLKAKHPISARSAQVDRHALARLIKSIFAQGYATLDEVATYALSVSAGVPGNGLDSMYLRAASPDAATMLGNGIEDRRSMLRLYATLGPAQRQALRQGNQ